jgi:hypothetical protein
MSRRVLLWIAACQSRGIHRRIRNRWLSEHTTDYNHHHHAIDNYDDDWHWHNNQHDDKHDHNNDNAMRWQMLHPECVLQ